MGCLSWCFLSNGSSFKFWDETKLDNLNTDYLRPAQIEQN